MPKRDQKYFYDNEKDILYITFHHPFGAYLKEGQDFDFIHDDVTHFIVGINIPNLRSFDWRKMRGLLSRDHYLYAVDAVILTKKAAEWKLFKAS